ncbi:serine/threonine protein kinase [Candidatus Woesearchaeota archaeon]|nr:serine/threonine protein kinase [Candidatus Woesearchaeota archaeon]
MASNLETIVADTIQIPGFVILEPAGTGGHGTVYKTQNLALQRLRAIKIIDETKGGRAGRFQAIYGQEKALSNEALIDIFNHPHIERYYSQGTLPDGRVWMEFEWIEGKLLKDHGVYSAGEARQFIGEICEALQHMHDRNILFNDLKPENVLIQEEFVAGETIKTVKIIDSGIATEHKDGKAIVSANIASREISAPESILRGELSLYSEQWALGILWYRMRTGEHPFPHEDKNAIEAMVSDKKQNKEMQRRISKNKSLTTDEKGILKKLLAYDPRHRYKNDIALLADIHQEKKRKRFITLTLLGTLGAGILCGIGNFYNISSYYSDAQSYYYSYSLWDRKIHRPPRIPRSNQKYAICTDPLTAGYPSDRFHGEERYCQEFQDAQLLLDHAKYAEAGYALENLSKRQPKEAESMAALIEVYVELGFYREAAISMKTYETRFPHQKREDVQRYKNIIAQRKGWATNSIDFQDITVCELELIKKEYPECLLLVEASEKRGQERVEIYQSILEKFPLSTVAKFVVKNAK